MATYTYTTERCRQCKGKNFQYDDPNLTCLRCGAVNYTEQISPDEMAQLATSLQNITTQQQIDPRLLEFAQEHHEALANRPIEDQLADMRMTRQKPPRRRK